MWKEGKHQKVGIQAHPTSVLIEMQHGAIDGPLWAFRGQHGCIYKMEKSRPNYSVLLKITPILRHTQGLNAWLFTLWACD